MGVPSDIPHPETDWAWLAAEVGKLDDEALSPVLRLDQRRRWQRGERALVEEYLHRLPDIKANDGLVLSLIYHEFFLREEGNEAPRPEEYLQRFPQFASQLRGQFALHRLGEGCSPLGVLTASVIPGERTRSRAASTAGRAPPDADSGDLCVQDWQGRYEIVAQVGSGGFGAVYRGRDLMLQRDVAIKVFHRHRAGSTADLDAYLAEARTLAQLDHPNIVPVFDVGQTPGGQCYIVSKFIDGVSLAQRLRNGPLPFTDCAALVASVAEALHHAHQRGLVHRDIKPGNILLAEGGKPVVVDFGLALREEDYGKGPQCAGTPAYMSPEQARGEGHLVDARSDVYSLGVVLYESLTGQRPFQVDLDDDLLGQIEAREPRPPRQLNDSIPRELDRICLKALGKRASDRHSTALDLAEDLRQWLAGAGPTPDVATPGRAAPPAAPVPPVPPPAATASDHGRPPVAVVPQGLRSFGEAESEFFLALLPGPRDRDGLPESLRFWRARLQARNPEQAYRVGVIYGPSGCGKSSFVKAGLLPRLPEDVAPVYVEADADGTEARLLRALRKACPRLPDDFGLVDSVKLLRRDRALAGGRKVVLFLDQFEQWLHAHPFEPGAELTQAVRQCDGTHVQCVLMVRDDFWMSLVRFLRAVDVPMLEGQNSAAVDLFDPRHARAVLAAFGRAYGALPTDRAPSREQESFLDQSVAGLTQGGWVIPVRLSLFAEMVKGRPWTPATLREVGGARGIGVAFLEEAFSGPTAPPENRLHQRAARAVLRALLPEAGAEIKGQMQSRARLLAVSGYEERPHEFDELMRVLDTRLRLVTPTEHEDVAREGGPYYQLTHDYLVDALRRWLTYKQSETLRGRVQLRLAERATLWGVRPQARHLPALWEWLGAVLLTRARDWTPAERAIMRSASRYYAIRGVVLGAALLLLGWAVREYEGRTQSQALHKTLLSAQTAEVPAVVAAMTPYRRWVDPLLRDALAKAEADAKARLRLSLALLSADADQVDYLYERLLDSDPEEFAIIRQTLAPRGRELAPDLWAVLEDRAANADARFRAACALAKYAPEDPRWEQFSREVAAKLVAENPLVLGHWKDALAPAGERLLPALAAFLEDDGWGGTQRRTITKLYQAYANGQSDALERLEAQLARADPDRPEDSRAWAKRRARLGAALVAMNRPDKVWPLFVHTPDPTARSYLIEFLGPGGADPRTLEDRLDRELVVSARRALILALGGFGPDQMPPAERDRLAPRLLGWHRDDHDPGIHAAAEWLLRQWGKADQLRAVDREMTADGPEGQRRWYVNRGGQTMMILQGPVEFGMGEGDRRHSQLIDHSFAIASREVTVEEFLKFRKDHLFNADIAPSPDCPVNRVTWYKAAAYCNWLSQQEDIPPDQWCYQKNEAGEYAEGMTIVANYASRSGYRLPTEAEWEYACRANAQTAWSCGQVDAELMSRYAWWYGTSIVNGIQKSSPVGRLKPNDFGLFDMHGNAGEWCQEPFRQPKNDVPHLGGIGAEVVKDKVDRAVVEGSFSYPFGNIRSTDRGGLEPGIDVSGIGFRPVRSVR